MSISKKVTEVNQNMSNNDKKTLQTSKKQKFIGYKTLVDPDTGETYPMQINVVEDRDFNFHKIWFQHFVNGVDGIANQKLRLAFWIIDNLNQVNELTMTQRAISEKSGISYETVNRTIKALCKKDKTGVAFLQKINGGAYRVNPEVIFKGSYSNRMGICYQYRKTDFDNRDKSKDGEENGETDNTESTAKQLAGVSAE
jgi:hypothetical protein